MSDISDRDMVSVLRYKSFLLDRHIVNTLNKGEM